MLRFVSLITFVLAMALTNPAPAQNLVADGGFERPPLPSGLPSGGWRAAYGDAASRRVVVSDQPHSGRACLLLNAPTIPAQDQAVSIEQDLSVRPGQALQLRAWLRGDRDGSEGLLAIVWHGPNGSWISHVGRTFGYRAKWSEEKVTGVAPEGAVTASVRVDLRSVGKAWVDDVRLTPREPARLVLSTHGGPIAAGSTGQLVVRVLDGDGDALSGRKVLCSPTGSTACRVVGPAMARSDERGEARFGVAAGATAHGSGSLAVSCSGLREQLPVVPTRYGEPAALRVTPESHAPRPGACVHLVVQAMGRWLEPVRVRGLVVRLDGGQRATTGADGTARFVVQAPVRMYSATQFRATAAGGLKGLSERVVASPPLRPDLLTIGKLGFFVDRGGKPFIPLGGLYANRIHKVEGGVCVGTVSDSIVDATPEQIRQWYAYLKQNGVTALRAMLRDHTRQGCEPMDIMGRANLPLLARWEQVMALARPYGIRFLVTLHESWYATYAAYFNVQTLERCVLPRYTPAELGKAPAYARRFLIEKRMLNDTTEPMTDPDVLQCQRDYLSDLIPRLRNNPDILAYELENEQPNGYFRWSAEQIATIRRYDPSTPIGVSHLGSGLVDADPVSWSRRAPIDFYTYHLYPSVPVTDPNYDYGAVATLNARYAALGKPVFSGEAFGDEWFQATPHARHLGARDVIWAQVCGGNIGCMLWDTVDEPIKEFRLARSIAEEVGLGTWRRQPPVGFLPAAHNLADDGYFHTNDAGAAHYRQLAAATAQALKAGQDVGYSLSGRTGRPCIAVRVPVGWDVQAIRSTDGRRLLAYVRNLAGGTVPLQAEPRKGWTRSRRPVRLVVTIQWPITAPRGYTATDLDTGETRRFTASAGRSIDLGITEHDWAVATR